MKPVEIQEIPLNLIHWPQNVRSDCDKTSLAGLAQSLAGGLQTPIRVMRDGDGFMGIVGYRRYLAAGKAAMDSIAAIVEEGPLTEAEIVGMQIVENNQRENLNPMDLASGLDRFMKAGGFTASQAAAKQGMSNGSITRSLSLLSLPEPIRALVASGKLSASGAYQLARVDDPIVQAELAAQLASGQFTRDALAGKLRSAKRTGGKNTATKLFRVTALLGEGRSVTVMSPNLTLEVFIESLKQTLAEARRARARGYEISTFAKSMKDQAAKRQ